MRQHVYTMSISNNRASFHLWGKQNLVKHQKVSMYYEVIVVKQKGFYPYEYMSDFKSLKKYFHLKKIL